MTSPLQFARYEFATLAPYHIKTSRAQDCAARRAADRAVATAREHGSVQIRIRSGLLVVSPGDVAQPGELVCWVVEGTDPDWLEAMCAKALVGD